MFSQNTKRAKCGGGFSLIELLVVIAIIAIIAAILFPVFGLVKENSRKATCMEQMQSIYQAVEQYKLDHNQYPPTLYGYVELPNGTYYNGVGSPAAMNNATMRPLYMTTSGKYLKSNILFTCPDTASNSQTAVTTAVFPTAPGVTASGTVPNFFNPANPAYFYQADLYHTGPQVDKNGKPVLVAGMPVTELHYSLSWTTATGPGDALNQLKYPSPPGNTVLTWCTYHVAVAHSNTIPVLMITGTVKPVPTDQFVTKGPLNYAP